jgi:hypothetical protein
VFFTGVLASALISAVNGVGQNLKTVLETGELETAMKVWARSHSNVLRHI